MKVLTVCVLGCAMMVLARAAALLEEKADDDQTERIDLGMRFLFCPSGWTKINDACFRHFQTPMSWAKAENNCRSQGGHLASVKSIEEYHEIQSMILFTSHDHPETWIGGSDAQDENLWLWSDGSAFHYSNWCPGEPNNLQNLQHCTAMNHGDRKCWDDAKCKTRHPYVCAIRGGRGFLD